MGQVAEDLAAMTNVVEVGGGGPLFGVDGVVILGHGRSRAASVAGAIALARHVARSGMVEAVRRELAVLWQAMKE